MIRLWTCWLLCALCPDCVLVYACTLPLFFNRWRSKEPPPLPHPHMFLHRTSIRETCTTWQQIASSTMRDFTEHDFPAHIVKKKILQKIDWVQRFGDVRKLEIVFWAAWCSAGQRVFSPLLKKIFAALIYLLSITAELLFYFWFMLLLGSDKALSQD